MSKQHTLKLVWILPILFLLSEFALHVKALSIKSLTQDMENSQKLQTAAKQPQVSMIANNLKIPWQLVFLNNNDLIVTERPGTLALIHGGSVTRLQINKVAAVGEGGLLGAVLDPNFNENHYLYLYYTTDTQGKLENRVYRYEFLNNSVSNETLIIGGIRASNYHDGGQIAFGPDGKLYITTGDANNSNLAQDIKSLNGKILRINADGSIPSDNPFNNAVYSYGHRNPEGLAWDSQGNLWETENGPSRSNSGEDEINLILKGQNYGWPIIKGSETKTGMVSPIIQSGQNTWAPAGAVFYNGSLFFGGLKGQALYEYMPQNGQLIEHFKNTYGRIRSVVIHNGVLYFSTSNTDSRGNPFSEDDKIYSIVSLDKGEQSS